MFFLAGNYAKHVAERGGIAAERDETFPYVFMKPPSTTLTHPGDPIVIPRVSPDQIDWECELGVVIGRRCRHVDEDEAMGCIAGYTVVNDISDRAFKPNPRRKPRERDKFFDWMHGKWHDTFCPMGPVHPVGRRGAGPAGASDQAHVNGQVKQDASTAEMVFPVPAIVAFLSEFVTLQPGDVIATGTPGGRRLGLRNISAARRPGPGDDRPDRHAGKSRRGPKKMTTSESTPLFRKLMVANRGEIAIRVFRSAHELGIRTVAIYSHEDRFATHRLKADEAYEVGRPGEPIRSYLNIEAIVELAKAKDVDAIHPGYGFLSENAEFARACAEAGIAFVGPRAELLDLLGDKVAARRLAREAGIPVLSGSDAPVLPGPEAKAVAAALGYPVIVKAAMGGGGRGMRVVESPAALDAALDQARREAGHGIRRARRLHREVHAQRQAHRGPDSGRPAWKPRPSLRARLLGAAPAPEDRRDRAGAQPRPGRPPGHLRGRRRSSAATSAMTTPGPSNSWSTSTTGGFFFIEVNPRIQVEHTVTEIVTNVDLVKSQILIAAG